MRAKYLKLLRYLGRYSRLASLKQRKMPLLLQTIQRTAWALVFIRVCPLVQKREIAEFHKNIDDANQCMRVSSALEAGTVSHPTSLKLCSLCSLIFNLLHRYG